ncbi:non-ribosomal peptide synthetase [Corallococcus llansteffanensis]|nr:non-ribosomal peptide synthetase [Corallococcus llansteffanensis]
MDDFQKRLAALPPEKQELLLRKLRKTAPPAASIPRRASGLSTVGLSFAQQRLWFLEALEPGSARYNLPAAVRLEGVLDVGVLEGCFQTLVRRHEALRTVFRSGADGPEQVIAPAGTMALPVSDLTGVPAEAREAEVRRCIQEEAGRAFDLLQGPLLRGRLLKLGAGEHVLVLTMHHIVSDGWSMGVLIREVALLYAAGVSGQPSPLPELPLQYADYAVWQREWMRGEVLEKQLAWWRLELTGAPQALELPTDHARPEVQGFRGASVPVRLPRALSDAVKALAQREHATPYMVLLSAYAVLLGRYAGQDDVSIGCPIAGRGRQELEGLIGFFVNTLVLRARLSLAPSFRALLAQVRETTHGAYAHQDVPFEKLVEELRPQRSLDRAPLVQVVLSLQNAPTSAVSLPGLRLEPLVPDTEAVKFELGLSLAETDDGFSGAFEYSTELFDAATVERMAARFQALLTRAVARPELPLSRLSLLTEDERHQVRVAWNPERTDYPRDQTLAEVFADVVARRRDAVALEFGDQTLTYGALDARARRLAWLLREKGVGTDSRVALCVERSLELVVALVAILQAGGAYVPLDPDYPRERLVAMLEDARPTVLITTRAQQGRLPAEGLTTILLDELVLEGDAPEGMLPRAHPQSLAYIDFTSGSTGRPKGVGTPQAGVLRTVFGVDYAHLGPEETFLLIAPISFDASTLEVWGALLHGARLVVFPPHAPSDVRELEAVLVRHGVTTLHLTAGLFTQMVEHHPEGLRTVRQLLTGGDVVSAPHVRRVLETLRIPVTACYGPTESTLFATCHRMTRAEQVGTSVPIGRPIGNTRVYVVDAHGELVAPGLSGELFIGGDGLARGYVDQPALTAERFVPDPFGDEPGARLYRTGDLARWRKDGVLEFLGRMDSQVKVRGYRVELAEVESALLAAPGVTQALVVAAGEGAGDKRLVAYVVCPEPVTAGLRAFVQARLPDFMVPSVFVRVEAMPLTANGKVDRKALPPPEAERASALATDYAPPRDAAEQQLTELWARVLRVARVGIHDNFFALGGDSILSLQVVAQARQAGLAFTPKQLFQHQTVAALAAVARRAEEGAGTQGLAQGPVPLTPVQRAFLEDAPPHAHHFNQALLLTLQQPLPPALLTRALEALVLHHDALRLRFTRREDGTWAQDNAGPEVAPRLEVLDFTSVPPEALDARVAEAAEAVQRGVRLEAGLLLNAAFFDTGPGRPARLLLVVHHLAVDAVSWRILLEDLETACRQLRDAQEPRLPAKSTSFQAWAHALARHARSDSVRAQLGFWSSGPRAEAWTLPVERTGGANDFASARTVSLALDAEETRLLVQEVPGAWRVRLEEVLLAALAHALCQWSDQPRVLVELEAHGREELTEGMDLSRTVGWFTASWPVPLPGLTPGTPGDVLRAVRDELRQLPGPGLGYGLLRELGTEADAARLRALPRPRVSFNYLGQLDASAAASAFFALSEGASGTPMDPRGERRCWLDASGFVLGGRLQLSLTYSEALHTRATVEGLVGAMRDFVRAVVAGRASGDTHRFTPTDFPLAGLTRPALDRVVGEEGAGLEDLYPLSPMQQGMLFHALLTPDAPAYFVQTSWRLHAALDPAAFRRAWDAVVAHHPILRTGFRWEGLDAPLQVVHAQAHLPWEERDWRGLSDAEQRGRLEVFLTEDRVRGFELQRPPLMRVTLVRLGDSAWQLVWSQHHLLLDGWSLGLLLQDLFAVYDSLLRGAPARLPPRPAFRDYIAWLTRQPSTELERFWRESLRGFTAPTPLPGDQGPVPTGDARREMDERVRKLSEPATAAVQGFARRHQLTLNTLARAAWALVLGRWSGEDDVVFGATVAGRPTELPGAEAMVGLFINALPVRVRLPRDADVLGWLQQLQAQQAEQGPYEHGPLAEVQRFSEVPRGTPLFDSLLVFENYPVDAALQQRAQGLDVREVQDFSHTNYPLTASVAPGAQLALSLTHEVARFGSVLIERLLGQWALALEQLAASAGQRLGDVSLLTREERQQVLVAWNDTAAPREDALLHDLIAAQAKRTPHEPAVRCGDALLTFEALDTGANRLAHHLRALGVGPEVRVGLLLERSVEAVLGVLAILKAGGAYVPLDPGAPDERLRHMFEDASAGVLLTHAALAARLRPPGAAVVLLDEDAPRIARQPGTPPDVRMSAEQLAYVLYTSGSTGRPKGVMIPHASVANLLRALEDAVYRDAKAPLRVSINAPLTFDASVKQLIQLASGHTLCILPEEARADVRLMREWVERYRLDVLDCSPAHLRLLLEEGLADAAHVPGRVLVGGEALVASTWRTLAADPRIRFFNVYGPTECTVDATACDVRGRPEAPTLGRPLRNVRLYVLDAALRPVSPGMVGELFIGGAGVGRGYLGQPGLTAERFVPDPFGAEAGARLYRTGDRVRHQDDGGLEYLGRTDFQVKVRGYRIELSEIEAVARTHPAVRDAVVVVRDDGPTGPRLVAFVLPTADGALDVEALRAHLRTRLPEYMLPSAWVTVQALPLTPHGKVDRRALLAPTWAPPEARDTVVPPRDALELRLVTLWQEVLGVPSLGIRDDFFELGGHSLLAVSLMGRIALVTGRRLPVAALFEGATVEHLAKLLRAEPHLKPWASRVPLQPKGGQRPVFLVHPGGGNVLCYVELARRLGPEQPVHAFQARGLDGLEAPHTRVEAMAAHYVEELRKVQPHGPYRLGGWSLGGLIAFEMARQLVQSGEQVARLLLIDTRAPDAEPPPLADAEAAVLSGLFLREVAQQTGGPLAPDDEGLTARDPEALLQALAQGSGPGEVDARVAELRTLRRVFESTLQATWRYVPDAYPGAVTLLRATRTDGRAREASLGWERFALGGVEVHAVEGDHFSVMRSPDVDGLAERVRACLG